MKNESDIGHYVDEVLHAFSVDIFPTCIGVKHIERQHLRDRQSELSRKLIPDSEVILICDGTYAYHQKSQNKMYQRKSFSMHKHRHLCKPFTVCTTDGYTG